MPRVGSGSRPSSGELETGALSDGNVYDARPWPSVTPPYTARRAHGAGLAFCGPDRATRRGFSGRGCRRSLGVSSRRTRRGSSRPGRGQPRRERRLEARPRPAPVQPATLVAARRARSRAPDRQCAPRSALPTCVYEVYASVPALGEIRALATQSAARSGRQRQYELVQAAQTTPGTRSPSSAVARIATPLTSP